MITLKEQLEVLRNSDKVLIEDINGSKLYTGYVALYNIPDDYMVTEIHMHVEAFRKDNISKISNLDRYECKDVVFGACQHIIVKK